MPTEIDELYGRPVGRDLRFKDFADKRSPAPKSLWQRHHEVINYHVLGMKNTEIAEMLGITEAVVSRIVNSEIGQKKIQTMRAIRDADALDAKKEIDKLLGPALKVYHQILNSEGDGKISMALKKQAADTVALDLAGLKAPTKVEGRVAHAHAHAFLGDQEIEELKARARARARSAGDVVEAEVVE